MAGRFHIQDLAFIVSIELIESSWTGHRRHNDSSFMEPRILLIPLRICTRNWLCGWNFGLCGYKNPCSILHTGLGIGHIIHNPR